MHENRILHGSGWTNEAGRDPQLEYRLSIYHAQKDDSGRFTCITPMGHRHSVDIVVAGTLRLSILLLLYFLRVLHNLENKVASASTLRKVELY